MISIGAAAGLGAQVVFALLRSASAGHDGMGFPADNGYGYISVFVNIARYTARRADWLFTRLPLDPTQTRAGPP